MVHNKIIEKHRLQPFVKDVFQLNGEKGARLAFYADGFPGLVFLQSDAPAFMLPKGKPLSPFFIYGQTIHPVELELTNSYRMLVFQLQPFAVRALFGVNPKLLNDECHDLAVLQADTLQDLQLASETTEQVEIMAHFIAKKALSSASEKGSQVQLAIGLILSSGGKIPIKALSQQLNLTERTLQRLFLEYVGLPPKQFAKIVQFQQAFNMVSEEVFDKLTEIVFENGYADQSHFIRNFRRFTGQKPSDFKP